MFDVLSYGDRHTDTSAGVDEDDDGDNDCTFANMLPENGMPLRYSTSTSGEPTATYLIHSKLENYEAWKGT